MTEHLGPQAEEKEGFVQGWSNPENLLGSQLKWHHSGPTPRDSDPMGFAEVRGSTLLHAPRDSDAGGPQTSV